MKANEFRIGNLIQWKSTNSVDIVKEILTYNKRISKINSVSISDCIPIPLTEEWLLKFGGIKDESNDTYLPMPKGIDMRLYLKYGHVLLCKGQTCPLFEYEHITNVHQLQNLFFALTGTELEIK